MLRTAFLLLFFLTIFGVGMGVPFVLTLGYLWTDLFRPASVVYSLKGIPYAFLVGAAAVAAYFITDRRSPPKVGAITILTIAFAFWVTVTTLFFAIHPEPAWAKWDWAVKSMLFSVFIPFVIRSRIQIEAFVLVYIFSLAANLIPVGIKTMLNGGRYGIVPGLFITNSGLNQSEILAVAAVGTVPLILFAMKHGKILPRNIWSMLGLGGLLVMAFTTVVGTYARTGLVALVVLALAMAFYAKRKVLAVVLCALTGFGIYLLAPPAWIERMATISANSGEERDDSALTRFGVWRWTLDFVANRPFGGGFEAYLGNEIIVRIDEETGAAVTDDSRAFHSSYFEVLGEHGWIGIGLFGTLILCTFWTLFQIVRHSRRRPSLAWCRHLAIGLQTAMLATMAGGAFTSMAFQPIFYYFFALSVCVREYVRRVEQEAESPVPAVTPVPSMGIASAG